MAEPSERASGPSEAQGPDSPRKRQTEAIERLAKALEYAYPPPGRLFLRSLLAGMGTGLGATVGVTLLVTLVGYVLSFLGYFEPLHSLADTFQSTLKGAAQGKK